jgi:2OG-Fe(II) oxygenase superfamily
MFEQTGLEMIEHFLPSVQCQELLRVIGDYRKKHDLPLICRPQASRSLKYMVVDGDSIYTLLPDMRELYSHVNGIIKKVCSRNLVPLSNKAARININIIPPGGEYRWHYDRNAVTAVLFLNKVEGGETEMYPNYRIHLGCSKHTRLQRWLDFLLCTDLLLKSFGKKVCVSPRPGFLIIMRGDKCLHSVRAVEGTEDRISITMAFDVPDVASPQQDDLDSYLYTPGAYFSFDPNYQK